VLKINGTTAVAAAETPDRNENRIVIQACRILLLAESCITFFLFYSSRPHDAGFGSSACQSAESSREGDGWSLGEQPVCQNDRAAG
jgi:hypothetical protein